MTFVRATFLFALLTLVGGIIAGRYVVGSLLGGSSPTTAAAIYSTNTPTAVAKAVKRKAQVHKRRIVHHAVRHATAIPTATQLPTLTPTPMATPTTVPTIIAPVSLSSYGISTSSARAGTTIAVYYTIDNPTGTEQRVFLGASIKRSVLSWGVGAISDTSHDVVATLPLGVSRHVRYFTLPAGLKSGLYDVAWGLRDAATGSRLALTVSAGGLTVHR